MRPYFAHIQMPVPDKRASHMVEALNHLAERYADRDDPPPLVLYTDNCCQDRGMLAKVGAKYRDGVYRSWEYIPVRKDARHLMDLMYRVRSAVFSIGFHLVTG